MVRPHRNGGPSPPPAKIQAAARKRCCQIRPRLRKDKRSVCSNASVEVDRLGLHDYRTVWISSRWRRTSPPGGNLLARRFRCPPPHLSSPLRRNPAGHEVFAGDFLVRGVERQRKPPSSLSPQCRECANAETTERESNNRKTTLEEENLSRVGLERLLEEKMNKNVRKRNGSPELVGVEIELDIDEMDVETHRELDRSVNNFKRALNNFDGLQIVKMLMLLMLPWLTIVMCDDEGDNDAVMPIENKNPDKSTTLAEQLDEYVDFGANSDLTISGD